MEIVSKKLFSILIVFWNVWCVENVPRDTSHELSSRTKRSLIWKDGVNWVQMIVGIGIPTELPDQSITLGTVIKAYYLLPTNSSDFTHPTLDFERRQRRSTTRWTVYKTLEAFMDRTGNGRRTGKACLLQSICEAAANTFERRSGILSEIIHAILTPSSTQEAFDSHLDTEYHAAEEMGRMAEESANCRKIFAECPFNVMQQFTKILY